MSFRRVVVSIFFALLLVSVSAFADPIPYSFVGNGFSVLSEPIDAYLGTTYLYTPTGPDYSLTNWAGPLWFSTALAVLSVPSSWPSWNCPLATESCAPRVLATPGDTLGINIEYGYSDARIFGFELQPNTQGVDQIQVNFFSDSTLLGTIVQSVSGNAGAMLFAAVRTSYYYYPNGQWTDGLPFTDVQITDLSGNS